jgi:hypothetical protein
MVKTKGVVLEIPLKEYEILYAEFRKYKGKKQPNFANWLLPKLLIGAKKTGIEL